MGTDDEDRVTLAVLWRQLGCGVHLPVLGLLLTGGGMALAYTGPSFHANVPSAAAVGLWGGVAASILLLPFQLKKLRLGPAYQPARVTVLLLVVVGYAWVRIREYGPGGSWMPSGPEWAMYGVFLATCWMLLVALPWSVARHRRPAQWIGSDSE